MVQSGYHNTPFSQEYTLLSFSGGKQDVTKMYKYISLMINSNVLETVCLFISETE